MYTRTWKAEVRGSQRRPPSLRRQDKNPLWTNASVSPISSAGQEGSHGPIHVRVSFFFDMLYCLDWVCRSVCSLELRTTLPQSLIAGITASFYTLDNLKMVKPVALNFGTA